MHQGDLINELPERLSVPKTQAKAYLSTHLAIITEQLTQGESINLLGFGSWSVKARAARNGVNPATKEKIKIPASKAVSFKVAKALKAAVNQPKRRKK